MKGIDIVVCQKWTAIYVISCEMKVRCVCSIISKMEKYYIVGFVAFPRGIAASLLQLGDGSWTHSPVSGLCGGHFGVSSNIDDVEPAPLG